MTLSILIPTYNRSAFLRKNLNELKEYIVALKKFYNIQLIISNNQSLDDSDSMINDFMSKNPSLDIKYYLQEQNIGLERNAIYLLEKASSDFIMYLGDDDYLELEYIKKSLHHLQHNPNTHVVIPNFIPVNIDGEQLDPGRDDNCEIQIYQAGFRNSLINSWRGHQLSGLIFKRKGLLDAYNNQGVNNMYLFIFFVAQASLHGDTYHITKNVVKVTQPGQHNKDWGYGKDGLINEVFDNYKKLDVNIFKKTMLQIMFIHKQPWRLWMYYDRKKGFIEALFYIWFSKNSTLLFNFIFPFQVLAQSIQKITNKLIQKI